MAVSEEELRVFLSAIDDVVAVFNHDGKIQTVVTNDLELFNTAIKDIPGHTLEEILPLEEARRLRQWIQKVFETRQPQQFEYPFVSNQRTIWFRITISLLTTDEVILVGRDISKRKHAEEALIERERVLQSVLECSPDTIYSLNLSTGQIDFLNRDRFCGFSSAELRSPGSILHAVHPDDLPAVRQNWKKIKTSGVLSPIEYRVQEKDGGWVWIQQRVTALAYNSDGSLQQILVNLSDITDRKQSEVALRESKERYQLISNMTSDYMFSSHIGADGRFTINWTAGAFEAISGYTMEEYNACGGWRTTLHPDDLVIDDQDQEKLRSNQSIVTEVRTYKKDDTLVWVRVYAYPIFDEVSHEYLGVYGAVQDITRSKTAEEEIKKRLADLETVNRISTALRGAQTLQEMLPGLLAEALAVVGSKHGAILLHDARFGRLTQVAASGWFTQLEDGCFIPGEGIAGTVFKTGKAHISLEFDKDPKVSTAKLPQIPTGWGGICVPIRAETNTIGVLFAAVRQPRQLAEDEIRLLTTVTEIAGNAIRRTQLHEKTQRQLNQLASLHHIDQAISSILDLHLLLNTLLGHITIQLGVDAADILLINPKTRMLEYKVGLGFRMPASQKYCVRIGEDHAGKAALEREIIGEPDILNNGAPCARVGQMPEESFTAHYAAPLIVKDAVLGVLEVFHRAPLSPDEKWLEFLITLAGQVAIAVDNATLFEGLHRSNIDLAQAYNTTIEGWSKALDLRDKETENHTRRVTEITLRLARCLRIDEDQVVHIWRGALLHDIGKMGVPDRILSKPDSLSDEEWVIMRRHPQLAYDLLYPIEYLRPALDIPYCHHEKWDGSGYPRGLKGEEIPLAARMFALADVYDALTSDRPYRKAWSPSLAIQYIRDQAGKHFDPEIAEIFLTLLESDGTGQPA